MDIEMIMDNGQTTFRGREETERMNE